jgi:NAD(P)-dependent dehydrogenase (short-subunit alcohol dehydrogenase family)
MRLNKSSSPKGAQHSNLPRICRTPTAVAVVGKVTIAKLRGFELRCQGRRRADAVAPGPVWTPLTPSTMPAEHMAHFGENYPIKRPSQPRELAPVCVMLASDEASYVSGTLIGVTGGKPIL